MARIRIGVAAAVASTLLAFGGAPVGTALAQTAAPGAMPLPPSARDPLPKEKAPAAPKKTRGAKSKAGGATSGGSASPDYRERIQGSGEMQLEDDPRVRPTMEGGRPGLGMRF